MFVLTMLLVLNLEIVEGGSTGFVFKTHEECSAAGRNMIEQKRVSNVVFICTPESQKKLI